MAMPRPRARRWRLVPKHFLPSPSISGRFAARLICASRAPPNQGLRFESVWPNVRFRGEIGWRLCAILHRPNTHAPHSTGDRDCAGAVRAPMEHRIIGARLGLPYIEPLTFLAVRMAFAVLVMAAITLVAGARRPDANEVGHSLVAGSLVHGLGLGGVFTAISQGVPAGISALIPGLQPIVTSTL